LVGIACAVGILTTRVLDNKKHLIGLHAIKSKWRPVKMRRFPLTILLLSAMIVGTSSALEIYILGPSGGEGGEGFTDEIYDIHETSDLYIWTGSVVEGVTLKRGEEAVGYSHGTFKGTMHTFTLQQGEYITGISGKYGRFVDSIQIHTNRRVSPRYGGPGGSAEYIYEAPNGWEVAGFCGRSGDVIDAIGVVLRKHS
jgi:hypothetical protein